MSEKYQTSIESAEQPSTTESNLVLVGVALLLPVFSGIALCFVTAFWLALVISGTTVIVSAAFVAIDAHRRGNVDLKGRVRESAGLLFVGMCLFWIVVFPLAFFRRRHFGGPNLGFLSVLAAAFLPGGPFLCSVLIPIRLPSCTSPEVAQALEQAIRSTPVGATTRSIDGHRELSYDRDANVRHGECTVHTDTADIPVTFFVEWLDQDHGRFQVRIPPPDLPSCTSPQVAQTLEQAIRSTSLGATANSIDGHRELSYDKDADVRYGECVVHTESGDIPVKFLVEWLNREQGQLQVRIPPTDLPSCTSPEVVQALEQAIRSTQIGSTTRSIDGHRELSYDKEAGVRYGECVAHTDSGDSPVKFLVEWQNHDQGRFQVRIPPNDLPSCTSPEVVYALEQAIRSSPVGAATEPIDGHRELSFDSAANVRFCECVVHTAAGDVQVRFLVEWQDRRSGRFQVRVVTE